MFEDEICPGCWRGCSLSYPSCHVGRSIAFERMQGQNGGGYYGNAWDRPRDQWAPRWDEAQPRWNEREPEWNEPQPEWDRRPPREPQPPYGREPLEFGGPRPFIDDADETSLIHRFQHCSHLLMHRRGRLSGRARALMVLADNERGHMSQRELAERLDIRSASMSELLAKMEESGLITRSPDPHDRRAILVKLTKQGTDEAQRMKKDREEENENLFAVLDDDEKAELEQILDKLTSSWREESNRAD